jgi:hypothetical protein
LHQPPWSFQSLGSIPKRETTPGSGPSAARAPTTFVATTLGLEVPVLSSLPRHNNSPLAKCGCKKRCMDFHGDHISTCTTHSGATKAHDWMVSVLGPLFCRAGHTVRTQHGVATGPTARRRGNSELPASWQPGFVLRPQRHAALWRFGSSSHPQQSGLLTHPQDLNFFFYRTTGRLRRTSMPLEYHRKKSIRTCSVFAARPCIRV